MKKIAVITTLLAFGTASVFAQADRRATDAPERVAETKSGKPETKPQEARAQQAGPKSTDRPTEEQEAMTTTEKMNDVVGLNQNQQSEIAKINKEQNEKMQAIRAKYRESEDKSGMREEIEAVQRERREKINSTLTPDQNVRWEQHQRNEGAQRKGGNDARPAAAPHQPAGRQ